MAKIRIQNQDEVARFLKSISFEGPLGGRVCVFTSGNSWYIDTLIKNLLTSYDLCNNNKDRVIGVFCTDDEGFKKAQELGYKCCFVDIPQLRIRKLTTSKGNREFYVRLTFVKTVIIHYCLTLGYTILYIDPDQSFNVNRPGPKIDYLDSMLRAKNAGFFTTNNTNYGVKTLQEISLVICCNCFSACHSKTGDTMITKFIVNSNLMLALPTEDNINLYDLDEDSVENIIQKPSGSDEDFMTRNNDIDKFAFWEISKFPPGNKALQYKDQVYLFHANCVAGVDKKRQLLQLCDAWFLPVVPVNYLYTLEEWQKYHKDENDLIMQASVEDESDGITNSSIGLSYKYLLNASNQQICRDHTHDKLVFAAFDTVTNSCREEVANILQKNGIQNKLLADYQYFKSLCDHKFTISPPGHGIDCHRHYEALIAGCIPIVQYSDIIASKYGDCPILYTEDYTEITPEYLQEKYEEMKTEVYDFTKLFLSSWDYPERVLIQRRGNYWTSKLVGKKFYDSYYLI